jgi:hypothetical protein
MLSLRKIRYGDFNYQCFDRFTPLQIELLKMSRLDLCEEELKEVKHVVARVALKHLSRIATEASERLGYTNEDFEAWLNDENQYP